MNFLPFHKQNPNQKQNRLPLSRPSLLLLTYGLYAVLCQLSMILLHTQMHAETVISPLLALHYAPMLEHALMSLIILAIGTYLTDRTYIELTR